MNTLATVLPLLCPRCRAVDIPRLEPGTGPHVAKAVCGSCHAFIKWLPKVKETRMHASINRVMLVGQISKYGMEVRYNSSGTPCASFTLIVSEQGQDGKVHDIFVPCECWGKKAEAAGEREAGELVQNRATTSFTLVGTSADFTRRLFIWTPVVAET